MMPSPPIDDHHDNCYSRWLTAGGAKAYADLPDCPAVAPPNLVAQRAVRPLTPIRTTMLRGSAIGSTTSANSAQARLRG
jgi:hypothetical protein